MVSLNSFFPSFARPSVCAQNRRRVRKKASRAEDGVKSRMERAQKEPAEKQEKEFKEPVGGGMENEWKRRRLHHPRAGEFISAPSLALHIPSAHPIFLLAARQEQ